MLRRLFSEKWSSGTVSAFLEKAPMIITGSENPFLIVTGPFESGKSTLLTQIQSFLYSSEIFSKELSVYTFLKAEPNKHPKTMILNLIEQVSLGLSHLSKSLPISTRQDLLGHFSTYARKISASETENPSENLNDILESLNESLNNYPRLPKLTSLSSISLLGLLEKVDISDAFLLIMQALLLSTCEKKCGDESTELLVKVLLSINAYCVEKEKPGVLLRIDDSHMCYKVDEVKEFYRALVSNLVKQSELACVIEGAGQFEDTLRLLKANESRLHWFHFKDFDREESEKAWVNAKPTITAEEKDILWKATYGNFSLVTETAGSIKQGEDPTEIHDMIMKNAKESIEGYFSSLFSAEEPATLKEKLLGTSRIEQRSALYLLKKLKDEDDSQLKISTDDFSINPVIQELVIHRLLSYNPITEILGFDKGFIKDVLPKCQQWKLTQGWLEMKRNEYAYEKLCEHYALNNRSY